MIREEDISGKVLDHLGLVAVTINKMRLIEKIDERLPLNHSKTTMGQRVAAMIYNGIGFIDDRLYMFPQFLENKPVNRLFKGDLKAEYFNDDALSAVAWMSLMSMVSQSSSRKWRFSLASNKNSWAELSILIQHL